MGGVKFTVCTEELTPDELRGQEASRFREEHNLAEWDNGHDMDLSIDWRYKKSPTQDLPNDCVRELSYIELFEDKTSCRDGYGKYVLAVMGWAGVTVAYGLYSGVVGVFQGMWGINKGAYNAAKNGIHRV